jgi:hypothetical protein
MVSKIRKINIRSRPSSIVFHPIIVLMTALIAALLFALVANATFQGDLRDLLVYYFAPIGVPFIAYLFDRVKRWPDIRWYIDLLVVVIALLRAVSPIPLISGHALFLSYALVTTQTRVARWTAALVLLQVAYFKLAIWQDWTLFGGIALGLLAAALERYGRSNTFTNSTRSPSGPS